MSQLPSIMISTRDFDRLSALLEKVRDPSPVIDDLLEELERATLVEPEAMPANVVTMNSKVRFQNKDNGQIHEVELVYPHEADGTSGKISILAPAGAALLGLSVGDSIEWPIAGQKKLHLSVIEVVH